MFPFSKLCSLMLERLTYFVFMPDQGFTQALPRLPVPDAFMVERLVVDGGWEVIHRDKREEEEEEELMSWRRTGTGTGTGRGEMGWQRMPFEGKYLSCVVYHQLP